MARSALHVWLTRFVAAIMLATVGIHATAPTAQPFERVQGSAFSAATEDVSLKNGRKAVLVDQAMIEPVGGDALTAVPAMPEAALDRRAPLTPFAARAPPFRPHAAPHSPRAPPAA